MIAILKTLLYSTIALNLQISAVGARIRIKMKKSNFSLLILFLLGFLILFPNPVLSQLVVGQYEDEAPLQTWNSFGITTARSLSRGGTSFTLADSVATALSNPALLTKLPKFILSVSGSYRTTSLNKYGIVNTGTYYSPQNSVFRLYTGDFAGIAFNIRGWAFSLSVGALENYSRPDASWNFEYNGQLYYSLIYKQTGALLNYNLSMAKSIIHGIAIGLGVNLIGGTFEKRVEEHWTQDDQTISDDKTHEFSGFYINGGIVFDISNNFKAAAVVRTPYNKNADSESLYRFWMPAAGTDIQIDSSEASIYHQPLLLGIGLETSILRNLIIAAEASFLNWSNYSVDYFGEILRRDFKDVVRLNAGIEFSGQNSLFTTSMNMPLRLGIIYDPQPMKNMNSYYIGYTLGVGTYLRNLRIDLGYISGKEYGSGFDLGYNRILLTLNYVAEPFL